jgi:hypothetical protein
MKFSAASANYITIARALMVEPLLVPTNRGSST